MKLDPTIMRTMRKEDYLVLGAVEQGMKNFELVPMNLCMSIAKLRSGGANKVMSGLLRDKLLSHDCSKGYDGYRLTNSGYDILALRSLVQKGIISALGDKIGIGKESDVYIAATPTGKQVVLKFHRLGRTSFRAVRNKRDYLSGTKGSEATSWLFMSRLSALKEYAFMKALHEVGYPTPTPLAHSRHIVAMSLVRGCPLYQIRAKWEVTTSQAESIFNQSVELASRLAKHGLVHCDLNEFNLMVDLSGIQQELSGDGIGDHYVRHSGAITAVLGSLSVHAVLQKGQVDGTGEKIVEEPLKPKRLLPDGHPVPIVTLIDFPQMVSTKHPNAKELYERDVNCLIRFFCMKLQVMLGDGMEDMVQGWQWEDVCPPTPKEEGDAADAAALKLAAAGLDGGGEDAAAIAEVRLDTELKASGFSTSSSRRDLELYYFDKRMGQGEVEGGEGQGEVDDDEDDDADGAKPRIEDADAAENGEESDEGEEDEDGEVELGADGLALPTRKAAQMALAQARAAAKVKERVQRQVAKDGAKNSRGSRNANKNVVKGKRSHKEKIDINY